MYIIQKIAICLAAAMVAASAKAEEFVSVDRLPAYDPSVRAVAYMAKLVRDQSGGRHTIRIRAESVTGTDNLTVQRVRAGAIAMARVRLATFHNSVPVTAALSLPYLFQSTTHFHRAVDGPIGEEILAELESEGLIGLCFYDTGFRSFYSTDKPIRNAADLRGMKVRIQSSDMLGLVLHAVGATPVAVPLDRVSASLRTGSIDAAEFDIQSYEQLRHFEVAPFYSLTEHRVAPSVLVFSKAVWDRLPQKDRAILRAAAKASVPYMRAQWTDSEARARKGLSAAGIKIIAEIDTKSFKDAMTAGARRQLGDPRVEDIVRRLQPSEESKLE
jgi:tripartite ATP-independent transporter DctP family solute receptor